MSEQVVGTTSGAAGSAGRWMHGCELVTPASHPRMISKALFSNADWVCLDLEDAVPENGKVSARELLSGTLTGTGSRRPKVSVRVNGPASPHCVADVQAVMCLPEGDRPEAVVLPMVSTPDQVADISAQLDQFESGGAERGVRIHLMVETAAAVGGMREIAQSSPRIDALVLGPGDLAENLHVRGRATVSSSQDPVGHARIQMLFVARELGIRAVDGPFLGPVDDLPGFAAEAESASQLGYDGKWAIHPSQIEPCQAAFSWPAATVKWARETLELYERMAAQGRGTMRGPDGALVDAASLLTARRILGDEQGVKKW